MPENSWPDKNSYSEFEPIDSLLSEAINQVSRTDALASDFFKGGSGRRLKAALVLVIIWSITIALHLISWGSWLVWGLTGLLWIQAVRVLLARPQSVPQPGSTETQANYPYVSLMVAAKNEEAVIANLVKTLCHQDYPVDRYEVWVIDDRSTDQTPVILAQLQKQYKHLKVLRREKNAGGGKSGALNQVLPLTKGEIVAVFDADAVVPPDLLRRTLPLFEGQKVGAVQVRKAIANSQTNFWTRGQMAEMALDTYFQQQRTAITGIGELRGNGQFVRRAALESCGGWNEQTITDDLDLTIRLHLDHWDIQFLAFPAVEEEGVTKAISLWHQRSRWAEGGYQRYLDYWRLISSNRMGTLKTIDLVGFLIIQYLLPTAVVPDLVMAVARQHLPVLSPITSLGFILATIAMYTGLQRIEKRPFFVTLLQTIRGSLYMFHWLVVMSATTARMSVRPKQLKWVKTVHQGTH